MNRQQKVLLITAIVFVFVIIVGVVGTLSAKQKLRLYNIDQVQSELSSKRIGELENFIWEGLKNAKLFDKDTTEVRALARPASFAKAKKEDMTNYSFLVDIDEFKATYLVSFTLRKGEGFYETPNVNCPAPNLMKYPETDCRSEKTSTTLVTIGRYLPYIFNLSGGQLVTVSSGVADDGGEYLNVKVSNCGDEPTISEAREGVEKWIRGLGFDVENYKIVIPEYCDGEF